VLTERGIKIAPSAYYDRMKRPVSDADLADAWAANPLVDLYRANRGCMACASYGTPPATPDTGGAATRSAG